MLFDKGTQKERTGCYVRGTDTVIVIPPFFLPFFFFDCAVLSFPISVSKCNLKRWVCDHMPLLKVVKIDSSSTDGAMSGLFRRPHGVCPFCPRSGFAIKTLLFLLIFYPKKNQPFGIFKEMPLWWESDKKTPLSIAFFRYFKLFFAISIFPRTQHTLSPPIFDVFFAFLNAT